MFLPKQRHDREYLGVAFCCRENKSSSMRRLTFNSCSLLANIKCNAVCIFFLRITTFFHMARKINNDFGRWIYRLALAASADRSQKPLSMRNSFLPSMFENGGRQMLFRHVFQLLTRPFVDLFKFQFSVEMRLRHFLFTVVRSLERSAVVVHKILFRICFLLV